MKISKRSIPNDRLCFDHEDYSVFVATAAQSHIEVQIRKGKTTVMSEWLTPEAFISGSGLL